MYVTRAREKKYNVLLPSNPSVPSFVLDFAVLFVAVILNPSEMLFYY
jgi:hypothetical protein